MKLSDGFFGNHSTRQCEHKWVSVATTAVARDGWPTLGEHGWGHAVRQGSARMLRLAQCPHSTSGVKLSTGFVDIDRWGNVCVRAWENHNNSALRLHCLLRFLELQLRPGSTTWPQHIVVQPKALDVSLLQEVLSRLQMPILLQVRLVCVLWHHCADGAMQSPGTLALNLQASDVVPAAPDGPEVAVDIEYSQLKTFDAPAHGKGLRCKHAIREGAVVVEYMGGQLIYFDPRFSRNGLPFGAVDLRTSKDAIWWALTASSRALCTYVLLAAPMARGAHL